MTGFRIIRRGLIGAAALLCVMGLVLAALVAGVDAGHFRGVLVGYAERSTGRRITVAGPLKAQLFSLHPRITAENVTIGNPPWTPAGDTAHLDSLSVAFELPRPWRGREGRIDSLRLQGAKLTLYRDSKGHANWQRRNPDDADAQGLPLIASLTAANAAVTLDDQKRHLNFQGSVSAQDAKRSDGTAALQVQGSGTLNGHPVSFELTGDPLASTSHDHPYRFTFAENSSGSKLTADGALPKPFDFSLLEAGFEASGDDLKDLYFLAGVALPNTGHYRATGRFSRHGDRTRFADVQLTTGQTDVKGAIDFDVVGGRTRSTAKLNSQNLRLADFGLRAAGRETQPSSLLLSSAAVNPNAMRRVDAAVAFEARQIEVGRQVLRNFSGKLQLERGIATALPLSGEILGGKLSGKVKLDATQEVPLADVDLTIVDLQLAQWPHKGDQPPLEGAARLHLKINGRGSSVHEVAASADGSASLLLPQGAVRTSLAELTGIDLRGLGLTLEKNKSETAVRCAAVNFSAHAGVFTVQQMVIDTEPVRIEGEGAIRMDTESLDLVMRGEPKSLRVLRLKAPVAVRGTLTQPSFGIEKGDSKLILVDRGHGKDEDCSALVK
jgi:AsmA family protein